MKLHSEIPTRELGELQEMAFCAPNGCFVELGVYKGGSAQILYEVAVARNEPLHLFDTFCGIPFKDDIDLVPEGAFADAGLPLIRKLLPLATFHVGFFPDTMPAELPPIAMAHIDCDQYRTCTAAIELFYPLLVPGGIMAFDDWPFAGIQKAMREHFTDEYIRFTPSKMPYVIK